MEKVITLFIWPLVVVLIALMVCIFFRSSIKAVLDSCATFISRARKVGVGSYGIEAHEKNVPQVVDERKGVEEFLKIFENPVILDMEASILKDFCNRKIIDAPDREKALLRALATNIVNKIFEDIRIAIWASQITLLRLLNPEESGIDISFANSIYLKASCDYPDWYKDYPFGKWMVFLFSNGLIVQRESQCLITVRGREFLKYLISCGKHEPIYG